MAIDDHVLDDQIGEMGGADAHGRGPWRPSRARDSNVGNLALERRAAGCAQAEQIGCGQIADERRGVFARALQVYADAVPAGAGELQIVNHIRARGHKDRPPASIYGRCVGGLESVRVVGNAVAFGTKIFDVEGGFRQDGSEQKTNHGQHDQSRCSKR
jgi:hypothetical protein